VRRILTLITFLSLLTTSTTAQTHIVRRTTKSFSGVQGEVFQKSPLAAGGQQEPVRMKEDREFTGPQGPIINPHTLKTIKIGLFSPYSTEGNPAAQQLNEGVDLAIQQANLSGGYQGVPFQLIQRWAGDPWGAGSKEVIKLVYQDKVWGIIAYREGAGHIAQQIAAKAYAPVIAPLSTAVSVMATGVPWIFKLPPNDTHYAQLLSFEIIKNKGHKRIGMISGTDHDSRFSAIAIENACHTNHTALAFHLQIDPTILPEEIEKLIQRMDNFHPDCIIITFPITHINALIQHLNKQSIALPIYMPWIPGLSYKDIQKEYKGKLYMTAPFSPEEKGENYREFHRLYLDRYRTGPSYSAAYGYEAAWKFIKAIRQKGLNRSQIQFFLNKQFCYNNQQSEAKNKKVNL
jgi:branched-chain amino acid transport system substrate-binding protein